MSNRSTATWERRRFARTLALLAVALVAWPAATAEAQTRRTWSGAINTLWTTGSNWFGNAAPSGSADTIVFDSTGSYLSSGTSVTLPSTATTISGITLTNPANDVVMSGTSGNFDINGTGIDMSSGTKNLSITAGGYWQMYSGTLNVASGRTLSIDWLGGSPNGTFRNGTITINGGGLVSLPNKLLYVGRGASSPTSLIITAGTTSVQGLSLATSSTIATTMQLSNATLLTTGLSFGGNSSFTQSSGTTRMSNSDNQGWGGNTAITINGGMFTQVGNWQGVVGVAKNANDNVTLTFAGGTSTLWAFPATRGAGASLNVNFNGGVFQPAATTSNFFGDAANLYIGNNGALINTNGFNLTFTQPMMNGTAAGTVGFLTKSGAGVLTLSGSNTYTGVNTISAGVLNLGVAETAGVSGPLGNSAAANPGNIVLTGGTLQYSAANQFDYSGRFSTAANQAYNVDTNSQNVTWATSLSSSGGTLTKSGTGTLTITGSNSYTGVTSVNGGTLLVATTNSLYGGNAASWIKSNITTGSGATLAVDVGGTGEFDTSQVTTLLTNLTGDVSTGGMKGGSAIGFDTSSAAGTFTVADVIADTTGSGGGRLGVTKLGSGTLVLSASNTYSGMTTLTAGQLNVIGANNIGTGTFTISGGSIDNTSGNSLTLATNNPQRWNGDFTFVGSNNLNLGSGAVTLGATRQVTVTSSTLTVNGAIGGSGLGLTKAGAGTLVLGGANTYTGATQVLSGTLVTSAANVIADASAIIVASGATFRTGGSDTAGSISGAGTIDLASTLILGTWGTQTLTVSGLITGNGGLSANTGSGWLAITGSNNNSGGYTARAGTTYVGNDYAFGSGALSFAATAGTVVASFDSTTRTIGNAINWGAYDHTFGTATTGDLVFTGAWANSPSSDRNVIIKNARTQFDKGLSGGAGGRIKAGAGTLAVGGASTYTGTTRINAGTFQLGIGGTDGTLSTSSVISGSAGATLAFNRTNAIVQGTDFTATGISGGMGLSQIGTGTLTLSSSNSYTGGTVLSAGQLNINNLNAIGTGTFTIGGGSIDNTSAAAITLAANNPQAWNADFTFVGTRNLNLGTGAVTLSADRRVTTSSGTLTVGGAIGGAFGITKAGAGALVMSGAGTYSGDTTVTAGSLLLGANNAIPNGSLVVLGTGSTAGTLVMNGFDDTIRGLVFNGNGSQVANTNGGKLALVGSGTNPATITVNSGSHALHPDTTLGSDTTIDVAAASIFSLHGVIDGSKSLTKLGSGTMTIFGANTYTGGVFITNGLVSAQNSTALGTGTVTISGNSILNLNNYVIDNPIVFASGSGAVINSGTLVAISGTGTIDSGTGTTITTNYSVLGSSSFAFVSPVGAQVNVQSNATTSFSGEIAAGGDVKVLAGGRGTFNGAMNGTVTTAGITTFGAAVNSNVTVTGGTATFSSTTGTESAINTSAGTAVFNGAIGGVAHATQAGATSEIRGNVLSTADVRAENGGTVKLLGSGSFAAAGLFNGGSVIIDRDANLALAAAISGTGSLTKLNGTTLTLTGNNTYSGLTTISGGRLTVESGGSLNGTSGISVNGAEFKYNSAATLATTITFGGSGGTLSGTGTIGSALTVGTNAILSPGNSPGTQVFTGGLTWAPGGTYVWELKSLTGTPGTDWDLLNVSGGTFDISSLSTENRFTLNLVTLNGSNAPGPLDSGYVAGSAYEFQIASFVTLGSGTYGFGANSDLTGLFTINLTGWQGPQPSLGDMSVRVNSAGNAIQLVIVPEPGAIFLVGIGVAIAGWWRLRRRTA